METANVAMIKMRARTRKKKTEGGVRTYYQHYSGLRESNDILSVEVYKKKNSGGEDRSSSRRKTDD